MLADQEWWLIQSGRPGDGDKIRRRRLSWIGDRSGVVTKIRRDGDKTGVVTKIRRRHRIRGGDQDQGDGDKTGVVTKIRRWRQNRVVTRSGDGTKSGLVNMIRRWRQNRGDDQEQAMAPPQGVVTMDQTVMTIRRSASYPEERDVGTACRGTTPREIVSADAGSVSASSLMLTTKVERGRNMGKKEKGGGGGGGGGGRRRRETREREWGGWGGSYGDVWALIRADEAWKESHATSNWQPKQNSQVALHSSFPRLRGRLSSRFRPNRHSNAAYILLKKKKKGGGRGGGRRKPSNKQTKIANDPLSPQNNNKPAQEQRNQTKLTTSTRTTTLRMEPTTVSLSLSLTHTHT